MPDRTELLSRLNHSPQEAEQIERALAAIGWDSEIELVTLRARDVVAVLRKYLVEEVGAEEVEASANTLEMRDDVAVQLGREGPVRDAVHVLANPALDRALSHGRAQELCRNPASLPGRQPEIRSACHR